MENNTIHTLSIINGDVKLDGFTVKGVIDYNLKASYEKGTTINLTLLVKSQESIVGSDVEQVAPEGSIPEQLVECGSYYKNNNYLATNENNQS
ncbi:hypothetical protein [Clostridium intestinale]|uniref:Uncharacterized protein n=1 Tax=Clostridium intestinale URNW TaxID=1294142 RepID=U2PVU7_9CLOT|nr:hypothetical protein [Clostridium intestinale]ERK30535.1 hypothetical protein CINTURNW_1657 [Clostridium intestinale URNW]